MKSLAYKFTDKDVSPWGGLRLIAETYHRCGLRQYMEECHDLPEPGSNRGYSAISLIEGFIVNLLLGTKRLAHTGTLRYDMVIRRIFDWKKGMASQSTFRRSGRITTLILSARDKRRMFLERLFSKVSGLSPPFQISNT